MDKKQAGDVAVALVIGAAALGTGQIKFDPKKDLSLQSMTISVEMPKAHASCSNNKKGSGCVC